jgi:hypothetical protein
MRRELEKQSLSRQGPGRPESGSFFTQETLSNGLLIDIQGGFVPSDPFDTLEYDYDFICPECKCVLPLEIEGSLSEEFQDEIHMHAENGLKQQLMASRYGEYN